MKSSLRAEIKQQKPFDSLEQEVHLNLERTTAVLSHAFAEALKPFDITPTQYNVLRILRGAGPAGLCRNDVRDRMVSQVPDVTRLMDRLEESGLIERERSAADRRQVASRITAKGLAVLSALDAPVVGIHKEQLGHMSATQLRTLAELLELARTPACEQRNADD
jgi:DNA-binding MarR family transcriptional regulator